MVRAGDRRRPPGAPAVGAFVELEFPPSNGHGWERGVVQSVTWDARYFYVAYAVDGENAILVRAALAQTLFRMRNGGTDEDRRVLLDLQEP
jgi:hypothetical protein